MMIRIARKPVHWIAPMAMVLAASAYAGSAPDEVVFLHHAAERQIEVHIGGEHFTTYHYNDGQLDASYRRTPFLWPVYGEGGISLTRNYPMAEDAINDSDHRHQRSLSLVYGDVNGYDHWHNEPIITRRVETGARDDYAFIRAHNDWLDASGEPIVREVQELRFRFEPASARLIELVTTFKAQDGDVAFNDDKEGLIALRIRPEITGSRAGVLTNARGEQGERNVYGDPAPWMDYSGPIGEHGWFGIAIFDHPDNFRPGYWHVRDYGLMALNPFARADVGGGDDGSYTLPQGQTLTLRYAWFVHSGDHEQADIAERYRTYALTSHQ